MRLHSLFALGLSLFMWSACDSYQKVPYFQDLAETGEAPILKVNPEVLRLEPGDKLNIVVSSALTPEQAAQFNLPLQSSYIGVAGHAATQTSMPYQVDTKGDIDFPVVGKIRVAGLSREEVGEQIKDILIKQKLLNDAMVTVEVLNHYVNVLGEVNKPGRINITKDNLTILEAISMSGDLTIMGERQNVLVLRKENGVQKPYRVDLSSAKNIYSSPVYQLKQDDIVYVQPNKTRQRESTPWSNSWQNPVIYLSMTSVLVSVAVLLINVFKK